MIQFTETKFVKSKRIKTKVHVMESDCMALCDKNLKYLIKTDSIVGFSLCGNCLNILNNRYGGMIALRVELVFYFRQYIGGSSFLDNIKHLVDNNLYMTPNQIGAAIKTFRDYNFRASRDNNSFNNVFHKLH